MRSTWRQAKLALGLNPCAYLPRTLDDDDDYSSLPSTERLSDAALLSPLSSVNMAASGPMTPLPSGNGLRLSKSLSRSASKSSKVWFSPFL